MAEWDAEREAREWLDKQADTPFYSVEWRDKLARDMAPLLEIAFEAGAAQMQERAARDVCFRCRDGWPLDATQKGQYHRVGERRWEACVGRRIRALPLKDDEVGVMDGADRIRAERNRQVAEEGWTAEHDDEHRAGELALAAACYATPVPLFAMHVHASGVTFSDPWPWEARWDGRPFDGNVLRTVPERGGTSAIDYSQEERLRALEKAGALIAAEIDRLLRARNTPAPSPGTGAPPTDPHE